MAKKEVDITKLGPQGYRQLQEANDADYVKNDPSLAKFLGSLKPLGHNMDPYANATREIDIPNMGGTQWGESIYDEPNTTISGLEHLQDIRANNEPWFAKIGAGLAKGAILTGTTFLDGTIGLILGIGKGLYNMTDKDPNTGFLSGLWDNDFSKAMKAVNDWSERALPNYYTQAEQEEPWYKNIFTANFIGDKFIKNLGFTVGAFYGGNLGAALMKGGLEALQATKAGATLLGGASNLAKSIGLVKNASQFPAFITSTVGSTLSALNEGRIEALNNSEDWFEFNKAQIDDNYKSRLQKIEEQYGGTPLYDQLAKKERDSYNDALAKLSEDRVKMGNADLLMNIPILTASNMIQFGKMYANGFKTARRANNIINREGRYVAGTTKLGNALAVTKGALAEGNEEIAQSAASNIAGNYYATDVSNFYKAKTDREASQETLDWTKSFAQGINETVNNGSSWEEFAIGALTGALGMPRFRSARDSEGNFRSPITIEGGAINEWREYNKKIAREQGIADYLNNRVNSPEFRNYYQGLIRHNKYQNDMNNAAESGDEFNFKNAEHAQLVSDIMMFDNANKMEDLKTLISSAYDTSDDNLDSIVRNTTSVSEDGKLVGPFSQYAVRNDDGTISSNFGNEKSKQEMINKLAQTKKDMLDTIKKYQEIKEDIDIKTGQQLTDEQLEELTWMRSQLGNWSERAVSMSGDVRSAIGNILGNLESFLRLNKQIRNYEGTRVSKDKNGINASLSDRYNTADKNIKTLESAINSLNIIRGLNDNALAYTLASDPKFTNGLIKEIENLDDNVLSADNKEDVIGKLNDIVRLGNASKIYNEKFKEYLKNPQKQQEDHIKADEQAAEEERVDTASKLKSTLNSASNLKEFRDAVINNSDPDNPGTMTSILDEMESEGNEMAKNYRETKQYGDEIRRVINEMDEEPQVKRDALTLFNDQYDNSEDLAHLANPDSIYVNNENAFDDDSNGDTELSNSRFQNAQYVLQSALSRVNNDNKYKDRFSRAYKRPVEKREGVVKGTDKDTTGDSGTPTVPPVSTNPKPEVEEEEVPAGDDSFDSIMEENKRNNEVDASGAAVGNNEPRKYYRPVIPEVHQDASRAGDFRPFDVAVKEIEAKKGRQVDFSRIYNYLQNNGAFNYVNEGKLKPGDTIGFMIDPAFNDHTIFLIDKKNGQVVGSLDESEYNMSRYVGLKELEDRVRNEYNNSRGSGAKSKLNKNEPDSLDKRIIIDSSIGGAGMSQVYGYDPNTPGVKEDARAKEFWKKHTSDSRSIKNPSTGNTRENFYIEFPNGTSMITHYRNKDHANFDRNDGMGITIWRHLTPEESSTILNYLYNNKLGSYEGIAKYIDKVLHEPQGTDSQDSNRFIATPTTKVSKIMIGKIPYGDKELNLKDIPNVSSDSKTPIFGIVKGGVLTTNGYVKNYDSIIKPMDMSKDGRLYLLIPNGANKYSVAAVRVKHFNDKEFDINSDDISSTPIGEDIKSAITKLSTATSQDDVSLAMRELSQYIYLRDVMVTWFNAKSGSGIVMSRKVRKPDGSYEMVTIDGKEQIKEDKFDLYYTTNKEVSNIGGLTIEADAMEQLSGGSPSEVESTPNDTSIIYKALVNKLFQYNLPLQVSAKMINNKAYNNRLLNSNILTSNISNATTVSNWFITDYVDKTGTAAQAVGPESVTRNPEVQTGDAISGTKISYKGNNSSATDYYVDLNNSTIRDANGKDITLSISNGIFRNLLLDLAWAQNNFGNATASANMIDNKVITPTGKVLDRTSQRYLSDSEALEVKNAINRANNKSVTPTDTVDNSDNNGSNEDSSLPIFNPPSSIKDVVDRAKEENSFGEGSIIGYYDKDGKLYKGYLKKIGEVNGTPIYVTKERSKGWDDKTFNKSSSYYTVFPNGKFVDTNTLSMSDDEASNVIMKALSAKPDKVSRFANEKTLLYDPESAPTNTTENTTTESPKTGAALAAQREQAIMDNDDEFSDELVLRKATSSTPSVWNQREELKWVNRVLPQLSEQDRIRIVKGLIRVGNNGTLAWGQFNKGIITLSDVAAEGTLYHEAFHVVFNLLLDNNERANLYKEARDLYGNKDNLSLEEDMAEGFREYVMTRQSRGLGRRILDFFKNLLSKVLHWNEARPYLISYYNRINSGAYANKQFRVPTIEESRYRNERYTQEMQGILDKAPRDSQGRLLAPNGFPSNLNERQYAQVRTKAFKDWFGDWENYPKGASKVVDSNGEPKVVYHGGSSAKIFNTKGGQFGAGIKKGDVGTYFTTSKSNAKSYEEIYTFKSGEKWIELADLAREGLLSDEDKKGLDEAWEIEKPSTRAFFLNIRNPKITNYEGTSEKGYTRKDSNIGDNDGQHIIISDTNYDEYVAFNSNQIKSATDNIGTFSANNPDIRYRVVPNSSFEVLRAEEKEMLLKKGWTAEKFDSISQEERDHAIKCIAF